MDDIRQKIQEATKYVCQRRDLNKLLPLELKTKFQSLFPDPSKSWDKTAWRMYHDGTVPQDCLSKLGIDLEHPTVRDAVAFDLVKLDDGSVSNDSDYTFPEHVNYSPMEYERYLLNKNWRVHLAHLESEWSQITYANDEDLGDNVKIQRTVEKVWQGLMFSNTLLGYFNSIFDAYSSYNFNLPKIYVPFTNANDVVNEVALIPNTHRDLSPITSRAYYDREYETYKETLRKAGISNIATFALVDKKQDKTHTGKFLVKVQRKISENNYLYVVVRVGLDGKFAVGEDGKTPTIKVFESTQNNILCVCEDDFNNGDRTSTEEWEPVVKDIPMVKSTTSSHYSIFEQMIPEYDLYYVRNYFQFKTRLEGMELCLADLKRNVWRKEIRASEAFTQQTLSICNLFNEFKKNKGVVELVQQYYKLMAEWDDLVQKGVALQEVIDEKRQLLDELRNEYKETENSEMDKKIALGEKIGSLKLELDKSYLNAFAAIERRKKKIKEDVKAINQKMRDVHKSKWTDSTMSQLV